MEKTWRCICAPSVPLKTYVMDCLHEHHMIRSVPVEVKAYILMGKNKSVKEPKNF